MYVAGNFGELGWVKHKKFIFSSFTLSVLSTLAEGKNALSLNGVLKCNRYQNVALVTLEFEVCVPFQSLNDFSMLRHCWATWPQTQVGLSCCLVNFPLFVMGFCLQFVQFSWKLFLWITLILDHWHKCWQCCWMSFTAKKCGRRKMSMGNTKPCSVCSWQKC